MFYYKFFYKEKEENYIFKIWYKLIKCFAGHKISAIFVWKSFKISSTMIIWFF